MCALAYGIFHHVSIYVVVEMEGMLPRLTKISRLQGLVNLGQSSSGLLIRLNVVFRDLLVVLPAPARKSSIIDHEY